MKRLLLCALLLAACGDPAWATALRDGPEVLARVLDAHPEQVEATDSRGMTALHTAAERGDLLALEVLLARQADFRKVSPQGMDALCLAVRANSLPCASVLLDHGADPHVSCGLTRIQPLHLAALTNAALVTRLLAAGADVNAVNSWGETPLHLVARGDALRTADSAAVLVSWGASLTVQDVRGFTPLHSAAAADAERVVGVLAAAHADLEARSYRQQTPYEVALSMRNDRAATRLFELAPDKASQEPPLFAALRTDDVNRLANILPTATDLSLQWHGETALQIGERLGSRATVDTVRTLRPRLQPKPAP